MIELVLRDAILLSPDVVGIVGERVFPGTAEGVNASQSYVVYRLVAGNRGSTLVGSSDSRNARIEINCYSLDYVEVKMLGDFVQLAIEENEQLDVVFNGDQDFYETDTKLNRVLLDYSFWEND